MEQPSKETSEMAGDDELSLLVSTLPKAKGWMGPSLGLYQGFWCPPWLIKNIIFFQRHFDAQNHDIILATFPKSGTTWLKAIIFSIVNRQRNKLSSSPLLTTPPHELVPFLEMTLYAQNELPDLAGITPPRLFATHVPYNSLPDSIKSSSSCKIVYVCRNPLDVIVSFWHFSAKSGLEGSSGRSIEELVELYCKGEVGFGPFWEHILGYWRQSLERPEKVIFLKYEDLKQDTVLHIKKLAGFIGFPFSAQEERDGAVEGIAELCSFSNMKGLEVNKTGEFMPNFENSSYFRKGEMGDWVNYLSPSMVGDVQKVMHEKFAGSGFSG